MKQIFTNAAEAMKVAFELSKLLRRPVWRYMGVDKRRAAAWVVPLDSDSHNALQEV